MIKELALEIINDLPDDVSMGDIIEALYVRMNALEGLEDAQNGKEITHEDFVKESNFLYSENRN